MGLNTVYISGSKVFLDKEDAINASIDNKQPFKELKVPLSEDELHDFGERSLEDDDASLDKEYELLMTDSSQSFFGFAYLVREPNIALEEKIEVFFLGKYSTPSDRPRLEKFVEKFSNDDNIMFKDEVVKYVKDIIEHRVPWLVKNVKASFGKPSGGISVERTDNFSETDNVIMLPGSFDAQYAHDVTLGIKNQNWLSPLSGMGATIIKQLKKEHENYWK